MNEKEKRKEPRLRTLKGGTIVFNNGQSVVSCVIRDLSEKGARLKVEGALSVPDQFILVMGHSDTRHEEIARVVWRGADELGVTFK